MVTRISKHVLRAGIIGLGVGERHIRCYEAHPDCVVKTLCDSNPARLSEVGQRHPGKRLTLHAADVMSDPDIDVISIATSDDVHFAQVMAAIEAGKHIMVEKPMCQTRRQAELIQQALRKKPQLKLSSNHVLRVSSRFQQLREQIRSGDYGDVYYVEADYQYGRLHKLTSGWRGRIDFYSVVQGGGVHVLDLLLWLLDDEIVEVASMANKIASRNTDFRFDDTVVSLLKLESGAIAKVSANFGCVIPHFHAVQLFGTKQTFQNHPAAAQVFCSTEKDIPPVAMDIPYRDYQKPDLICSFVDCILGRGVPIVPAADVFRTMAACFTIEESVAKRKTIPFQAI